MATIADFTAEWLNDSPYIQAYTSGSTGEPKEIRLLKSDMLISARATIDFFGITDKSTLAIPLSLDYIAGKMMVVRAIAAKCRLLDLPVTNKVEINEPVDLLSVVPSQLDYLLDNQESLRNVRKILVGGAAVTQDTEARIKSLGIEAYIGYGMTETCSHIALRQLGANDIVYKAMPTVSFNTDSRECLVVESDAFSWGTLTTNDLVELISSTDFKWIGRVDDVINSGGIKVHPAQIEAHLIQHVGNALPPFYVVGEPSEKWGHVPVIVAECSAADQNAILSLIRRIDWPRAWKPARVVAVASLPRTSNGKIKRVLL